MQTEKYGGMENSAALEGPSSTASGGALTPSNVGFRLLQKSGWKEGSGLGATEQGRLEPVDVYVKNDKRGIGAKTINSTLRQTIKLHKVKESEGIGKRVVSKKASRRLKKELENEKKMQEQLLQRDLFMEFWPDNV